MRYRLSGGGFTFIIPQSQETLRSADNIILKFAVILRNLHFDQVVQYFVLSQL